MTDEAKSPWWRRPWVWVPVAGVAAAFGKAWLDGIVTLSGIESDPLGTLADVADWVWQFLNNRWTLVAVAFVAGWFGAELFDHLTTPAPVVPKEEPQLSPEALQRRDLRRLGSRMMHMGQMFDYSHDPIRIRVYRPTAAVLASLASLLIDLTKATGFDHEWLMKAARNSDDMETVATYLTTLGTLFHDGHIEQGLARVEKVAETIALDENGGRAHS